MRLCTETMGRERWEGKEERERREKREEGRGEEIMSFTVMQLKGQKEKGGRKMFMLCSSSAGLLESHTDHEHGVPAAAAVSQTKFM